MKFINTIVALLLMQFCLPNLGHGQIDLGVKANFSSSNIYQVSKDFYNSTDHVFNTLEYVSSNNAFSYGLTAYKEMGYLFLNADVMYRKQTVDYILRTVAKDFDSTDNYRETSQLVQIPITAGILYKQFKFGFGPMFNVPVERNNAFETIENIEFSKRKLETGFQFLVGVKINKIHIDLKRELSFTSLADNYFFNGNAATVRTSPNKFSLNIAYILN